MEKWYRTTRTPIGGGLAVKTTDCKLIEQTIIDVLEGRIEGITEVIYGNNFYIRGYRTAYNNDGFEFFAPDESCVQNLDNWKYVATERWNNILFIYVTDILPQE